MAEQKESKAVSRALEKMDLEALRLALTPRQRRFAEEYVIDFNGTAAASRAGYRGDYINRQAHQLLHHKGVTFLIDHLTRSKEAKIMSIDPDYVLQRVTDIINKEGAKDGDKLRGLELLARHLGMFVDRTEITGKDGEAIRIQEQRIAEESESFMNLVTRLRDRAEKAKTLN